jgi:hypothetical protein
LKLLQHIQKSEQLVLSKPREGGNHFFGRLYSFLPQFSTQYEIGALKMLKHYQIHKNR